MVRKYKWTWNARIRQTTLPELQSLAGRLGFFVTRQGTYHGKESPPDMLDALAECHRLDPPGTTATLAALLAAHGLLPEPPDA